VHELKTRFVAVDDELSFVEEEEEVDAYDHKDNKIEEEEEEEEEVDGDDDAVVVAAAAVVVAVVAVVVVAVVAVVVVADVHAWKKNFPYPYVFY
jgi:Ca2+/H+ antiporter